MKHRFVLIAALISGVTALSVGLLPANAARVHVGTIRQVNLPAPFAPQQIAPGPDGNMWFTDNFHPFGDPASYDIGRVTPAGVVTTFKAPTPANGCQCVGASGITAGPDGNVWFTGTDAGNLYSITPDGSTITVYPMPGATTRSGPQAAQPESVATGPDGNLWITDGANDFIDKVNPGCPGCGVTQYPLPSQASCVATGACEGPGTIIEGPDGAMWFLTNNGGANLVGRIDMGGSITQFLPTNSNSGINDITSGPDGNIWFTMAPGGSANLPTRIGRMTPTGSVKYFNVPASQQDTNGHDALGITAGPDGKLWFAVISNGSPAIDRMTVTGKTSIYLVPNASADPRYISAGPPNTNTVWATDDIGNDIDIVATK